MEKLTAIVAHDYQCPWCYLSWFQAKQLAKEFPQLTFEWHGYELLPEANAKDNVTRPEPSARFLELAKTDSLPLPLAWPVVTNSHLALLGAEYFKNQKPELFEKYNEQIYRCFWEEGHDISDLETLLKIVKNVGGKAEEFADAVTTKKYDAHITLFKEPAYAKGITHVTTFQFRGEQCAEAPYSTIRDLAARYITWYDN